MADYDKAIALNPNDADAYNNRGTVYKAQEKYDLALADYDKAIVLKPNDADAYNNRGIVYKAQEKYDLALADYDKAIALNLNHAGAYNNRGNVYESQEKYDLALADYDKAIALNPNDADAYNNRGTVYKAQEKYDLALADYDKAIALNSNHAGAYNNRGIFYQAQEKYDLALADCDKAIALNPKNVGFYNNRGTVYAAQEKYDLALADYDKAIVLKEQFESYANRAITYAILEEFDKAEQDFKKAAEFKPENKNYLLQLLENIKLNTELKKTNQALELAKQQQQNLVRDHNHWLGNHIFPERLQQVADDIVKYPELTQQRLTLFDAAQEEQLMRINAKVLSIRHLYSDNTQDKNQEFRRLLFSERDPKTDIQTFPNLFNDTLKIAVRDFFKATALTQKRQQFAQQHQQDLTALEQHFQQHVLLATIPIQDWISHHLITDFQLNLNLDWQAVRIKKLNYAEAILRKIFSEVLFNLFKYSDLKQVHWNFVSTTQHNTEYLTVDICNSYQDNTSIGSETGLVSLRDELKQLNDGFDTLVIENNPTQKQFSLKFDLEKALLIYPQTSKEKTQSQAEKIRQRQMKRKKQKQEAEHAYTMD